MIKISIDAMGGDFGASVNIAGAATALSIYPEIEFLFFGDEKQIITELEKFPDLKKVSEVFHTEIAIDMADKPSTALRKGRKTSSMWQAIDAVKSGQADVAVSSGNTGALMAMATFCLRTLPGIQRPAIAALWPTVKSETVVLDVGATVGAESQQLIDNAFMGQAMARALYDVERPKVALLNIGVEEVKGIDEVKHAASYMKEAQLPFDYIGFVEGDSLGTGDADVVVTEGFAGNIALKTAEGTAKQLSAYLKNALTKTLSSMVGFIFAKTAFNALRNVMDPRKMNGGVFLGLNGLVIKSHGGTDASGFASAVILGHDMAINKLNEKLQNDLAVYRTPKDKDPAETQNQE